MERPKRDLEALVASQKEQLTRYEKRLKDVICAYKGLLKEKEALETSLTALNTSGKEQTRPSEEIEDVIDGSTSGSPKKTIASNATATEISNITTSATDDTNHLQTQIITLMNSLATLSAEKSRMEASFQADKKQLRGQLAQKDQISAELQAKIKANEERAKADVDDVKAKWIIERQEREKETNNQMLMIRELQKLYADERHLKENIEMQLNNFKTQFASNEAENSRLRELQAQLKEARTQLKQLQGGSSGGGKMTNGNDELADSAAVLKQVQQQMQQLKEQHAVAIKSEQRRVMHAEEESRKQAALHENRVANLEARLAELSNTVGSYDRLRQQDQENIQVLKRQLLQLERSTAAEHKLGDESAMGARSAHHKRSTVTASTHDIAALVDDIVRLKKLLVSENARAANPIDVSKVLAVGTDHTQCQEEHKRMQQQCDADKLEINQLLERLQVQKTHIATLQEKVKVLNRNIDEQELELKQQNDRQRQAVKEERVKWKDQLAELENDCRCKVNDLEQQLQKQRQRSLQLLDEKEQEIKTLQTSFEIFHSATASTHLPTLHNNTDLSNVAGGGTASSDAESNDGTSAVPFPSSSKVAIKSKKLSVGENCHMLHYANEIARKDIEIAGLRKSKYAAETALRRAIHEKVTAQEDLCDKIGVLEEQVDRLERCKTREGANLEYLKNVIISFIVTRDADGKRHMMNAISAVLQFTPEEIQAITAAFHKK